MCYSTISPDDGQVIHYPKTLFRFPTLDSILDFPSSGNPKKPDNGPQFCPSCGGGMDESENYYTCVDCGYRILK